MKGLIKRYNRECRAAMMLLLIYSTHLFAFHAILSGPRKCLFSFSGKCSCHHKKAKQNPDSFLLLAKHETIKETEEIKLDSGVKAGNIASPHVNNVVFGSLLPCKFQLSEQSYKLYRLNRALLI